MHAFADVKEQHELFFSHFVMPGDFRYKIKEMQNNSETKTKNLKQHKI